jgi:hypothetical protein
LTGAGVLVWLPEIAQADLQHIARAIYVARESGDETLAALATRALDALLARRADAKKRLGSDDPLLLATVFHESLKDKAYVSRMARLDGIRLLPMDRFLTRGADGDVNQFPRLVQYWRSPEGPYGKIPPGSWTQMLTDATATAGKTH